MGTKISYKGNQVGSGNSSGAETIVDKTSLPSSGIENVIYRVTDSVSGETSYHAGNETEAETEQLAKYSDVQIIQVETIPSAGASHVGKIYQYIGATNLSYTNGYFYKCVSDGAASPSYSWEEVQVQKVEDATPHWTGTQAEYNAAASGIEDGTIVNITDDYQEGVEVVDVVEEDNEGVPTSAAVYDYFHSTESVYVQLHGGQTYGELQLNFSDLTDLASGTLYAFGMYHEGNDSNTNWVVNKKNRLMTFGKPNEVYDTYSDGIEQTINLECYFSSGSASIKVNIHNRTSNGTSTRCYNFDYNKSTAVISIEIADESGDIINQKQVTNSSDWDSFKGTLDSSLSSMSANWLALEVEKIF